MKFLDELTAEQQAAVGERLERFLAEPVVEDLFLRLQHRAYVAFLEATTDTDRAVAQAKGLALRELETGLKGLVNTGTRARDAISRS